MMIWKKILDVLYQFHFSHEKIFFLFSSSFNFPRLFVKSHDTQEITMINYFFTMLFHCYFLFYLFFSFCRTNREKRGLRFRARFGSLVFLVFPHLFVSKCY